MQPLNRELLWTSILVLLCCSLPSGCSSDTGPSRDTGSSSASESATERHDAASLAAPTSSSNTTASPHLLIASDYQPPDQQGFVGSQACQKCHAEISETYAAHPMGQSIRPIDVAMESQRLIDQHAIVSDEPQSYVVAIEEDQLVHHERITDIEGRLLFDTEAAMEYVVGSGARAMAYLHRRDNLLFMSPLNWYSGAAKWDFAPGHSADDRRRFDRRVNDDCLSCHAGRVNVISRGSNQYEQTAFHEMAIGCENCHGAGADHIQFRNRFTAQANEQTTTANDDRSSSRSR